jgi:predicted PhzF superfamily epimerase YddE/YHI9
MVHAGPGGDDADFTPRNFAPVLDLDEDQATWPSGRRRLAVAVEDDRVHVGGHAVTITRGEWVP